MRRLALLILFAAACGGSDSDPHQLGACEGWTDNLGNPFTGQCELACKKPPASTGQTCDTTIQLNCAAFDFEGTKGCCVPQMTTIKFAECAP